MSKKGFVFAETVDSTEFEHEDGWKINLRICSMAELKRIRKITVTKKVAFKKVEGTPMRMEWEEIDEETNGKMIWDFCITSWDNVFGSDGEPLECNAENKWMLMNRSVPFARFVTDCMTKLNEEAEKGKEVLEKN